jgi:hypothetical protein
MRYDRSLIRTTVRSTEQQAEYFCSIEGNCQTESFYSGVRRRVNTLPPGKSDFFRFFFEGSKIQIRTRSIEPSDNVFRPQCS